MCTLNTMTNQRSEECLKITETTNKILKAGSSRKKRKDDWKREKEREREMCSDEIWKFAKTVGFWEASVDDFPGRWSKSREPGIRVASREQRRSLGR